MRLWATQEDPRSGGQSGHPSCVEHALHVRLDLNEIEKFLILKYKTSDDALVVAVDPETGLPRPVSIKDAMAGVTIRCHSVEELRRIEREIRNSAESLRAFFLLAVAASGCGGRSQGF